MSFRGINTTVIQIRRQVFTEVARMAYANVKGEQANHLMRKIPYTIIPGEEGKLRKDIFLERAIVEERVRLAMGLPTRRMDEHNSVVSGLEDASIADKYYDPPLVNVIKFACNRCPEKLVKVSDLCQGCLAHPCMEVCPKKAITWESGRSIIDQDKCIKCGRCVGVCPYNAIVKTERPCAAACGMGAVGEHEAHCAVLHLDSSGCVVGIVQLLIQVELEYAANRPDVLDVGAGEPADEVDVMYAHIEVLTAGVRCKLERTLDGGAGVLRVGADENDLADVAVVDLALCLSIGLVEAAHKAQLEDQIGVCLDDLFRGLALLYVGAERLLAEHMLAVVHGNFNLLAVQEGRGNDNDRVQLRILAHFLKIGVSIRHAELCRNFLYAVRIYVADGCQLTARNLRCKILCVLITQTTQTYRTNLNSFHGIFSPFICNSHSYAAVLPLSI
mgnify:CR=1 FL=1